MKPDLRSFAGLCALVIGLGAGAAAVRAKTLPEAAGEWHRASGDYANTRFSPLDHISSQNVGQLRPVWTFATGGPRGQEAAPLVVGGTMYVVTPYPNILYALDLTRPGGPQKWAFHPKLDAASQEVACCEVVNRGAAYAHGLGESLTMAPRIVKDVVLVGYGHLPLHPSLTYARY